MDDKLEYPVVAHHRVIVKAEAKDPALLHRLFADFELVEPIAEANASSSGKYVSFAVSARFRDAAEMARFDAQLKLVPGLKMVL